MECARHVDVKSQKRSDLMFCKIFFSKKDLVAAICDEELLGKRINLKEKKLKIEISKNFYGGS